MLTKLRAAIPPHIKLIIRLYVLHLGLFMFYRILHYFINQPLDIDEANLFQKFFGFKMGIEFDSAIMGYAFFITVVCLGISSFFNYRPNMLNQFGFWFFLLIMQIYMFVCTADIPYFKQFGNHLNRQAFLWNDSPEFALGLIFGNIRYWGYILVFLATSVFSIYFSRYAFRLFQQSRALFKPHPFPITAFAFILLCIINVYVARGRTSSKSPLHEGVAIISSNGFINSIAINPNYTLWKSLLYNNDVQYKVPENINDYIVFTRKYLGINTPYEESISREVTKYSEPKNYNVVVVVMESMSVFKMGYYNGKNLTPNFYNIIKESVFFDHFFSSGIHTFNGLFSTNSGFPSIMAEQPLKKYLKKPFNGFGSLLKKQGYDTYFFTSHDPHFDNMQGFFKNNSIDNIISQNDLPIGSAISELGVPDHVLFDEFIKHINARENEKPFISVIMTSSDHGPWAIPENIAFKPDGETPQENSTQYADWSLGQFFKNIKQQKWYENTVFLFLGDHGLQMGHTYEMSLAHHHVPLVIHHPKTIVPGINKNLGYQPDITATIMGLLNRNYTNTTFGINLMEEGHPLVMFTADDKIGCINNRGFYYYHLLSTNTERLWKYEQLDKTEHINTYKSMADSMEYAANAILQTAKYLVRKGHFVY